MQIDFLISALNFWKKGKHFCLCHQQQQG